MKIVLGIVAVLVLMVLVMVMKNSKMPDLGVTNGVFKPLGSKPNGVSTQTSDDTKKVNVFDFAENLNTTKVLVKKACEAYGEAEVVAEASNYLHFVFTTGTMKYKDDVEFFFDEETQTVHYRSESRVGYSDMGLNKERYEAILGHYNQLKENN